MPSPDIDWIAECFRQGKFNVSAHAAEEMAADSITRYMLRDAMGFDAPQIIEDYPEDRRGRSCLILGWITPEQPVHIVAAYWTEYPVVITVYRPDPVRWENDGKTRK